MKEHLTLAKDAVNENSPSPTASMMKFQGGNLVSYGGTFCVQIPCGIDVDCAFNPKALHSFFRKERDKVTYAVSKGKLVVKAGREKVSVPCMEPEKMPIIDVHKKMTVPKKFLTNKALKALIECIDPSHAQQCLQGICFRDKIAAVTDRQSVLAMVSGLPASASFVLPVDTAKFMARIETPIEGFAMDGPLVKFWFVGGLTVCSQTMNADDVPNMKPVINFNEDDAQRIKLHPDTLEEIKGLKSECLVVSHQGIQYESEEGKLDGAITLPCDGEFKITVKRKRFESLVRLTKDNTILMTDQPDAVHADGGKFFKMTISKRR